ncbi:MAG: alpha-glucan family phosphorylase [Victivallaceae bacterium]|nr:alpha-glucan family phosphorylase [Victivallaceae bacterium]
MEFQLYNVGPRIPDELKFLEQLSNNVWWCWHPLAIELFMRVNPNLWRELTGNAKEFLRRVPQSRLEELARDTSFVRQLKSVQVEFERQISEKDDVAKRTIAYFSLEFGIHESIPIFSGGLGVLAGDHLKAASDLKLPLVAVGLLYRQGYFRQVLDRNGWQTEHYPVSEIHNLPVSRAHNPQGEEVTISIRLGDRELFAAVWILKVGNVPLVLLDTELPQNPPDLREVTWRLYGGDKRMRLHQELLLGIGGIRALLAMGYEPEVCHMNEGHAGFLSLARIAHLVNDRGFEPDVALETVWRSNVFTTHTPVPAGNEVFDIGLVRPYLENFAAEAKLDVNRVISWGIPISDRGHSSEMSMTVFGLRLANYSNAVSALHGEVARDMWKHLWPQRSVAEVPIKHITNGVHIMSWVATRLSLLYDRYLTPKWAANPPKAQLIEGLNSIPDEELWMSHELCRQSLVRRARRLIQNNNRYLVNGNTSGGMKKAVLDPDVLTIGFARRFATYKRATLLLRNQERLLTLLRDTNHPVQFIFAGKAHPADDGGKKLIQELIQFARRENVQDKFLVLENYDIGLARSLVQGVDVWLNTPRRPQEASGTSGMKAAINGVINCSILDGWWAEGYNGRNGWAIPGNDFFTEDEDRDNFEAQELFNLIENEIIPCFYERQSGDLPVRWIKRMKESIITGLGDFSSIRMVEDYNRMFYRPACESYEGLVKDNAAYAVKLVTAKHKLVENFAAGRMNIDQPSVNRPLVDMHVGDTFKVTTRAYLAGMSPAEVEVEAYFGTVNAHNEMIQSQTAKMKMIRDLGDGNYEYGCDIVCALAGRFGLTARITACGTEWDNSIPGFICWPR